MLYRDERISATIRDLLSAAILREMEFPGALVTLTEVELTQKRDAATIHVSVLPDEQGPKAIKRLNGAKGMLRHHLLKKLRIKVIPELFFRIDKGAQNAAAVEKALLSAQLHDEEAGS